MEPYRPEILEFENNEGKYKLSIPFSPETPVLKWGTKTYTWSEIENPNPKLVVFDIANNQVILIGGLGDPGVDMGHILILGLDGKERDFINLSESLPDLEELSRNWREMHNFPWIATYRLEPDTLSIWICRKKKAVIDLASYEVRITESTDKHEWEGSEHVYNKGVE